MATTHYGLTLLALISAIIVPTLATGDETCNVPWQDYYVWVKWVGIAVAFLTAYGIGANDVANNLGVCVGSRSLTMFQAIVLAGICEFIGSTLLGSQVVDTIKKGVTQPESFPRPEVLMLGMFCALVGAMLWLFIATRFGMPVSTTHSIVGGILGMALAGGGVDAINWDKTYLIIATWLISPFVSGIVGVLMFWATRKYIFRQDRETALRRSWFMFPVYTFLMMVVVWIYLLLKGSPRLDITEVLGSWQPVGGSTTATPPAVGKPGMEDGTEGWDGETFTDASGQQWTWAPGVGLAALVAVGISVVFTVVFYYAYRGRLARQIDEIDEAEAPEAQPADAPDAETAGAAKDTHGVQIEMPSVVVPDARDGAADDPTPRDGGSASIRLAGDDSNNDSTSTDNVGAAKAGHESPGTTNPVKKSSSFTSWGSAGKDVHGELSDKVQQMHDISEKFPAKVEKMFDSLLVIAAIFASIAHGANDVANSIGPLAAMIGIDECRCLATENEVPFWVMALGGGGIVIGVATYGHKVIRSVGVKLAKITPSRGFFIMFSKGVTVIIASRIGIPLSSTHCLVGATIAIGVLENPKNGVNWPLFGKIMLSWILTIIFAAGCSAALFSMMIYSPQVVQT